MALTKALNGFHSSRMRGSGANSTGGNRYQIAQGTNLAMYSGDLLKFDSAGYVTPITTTTDFAMGVLTGVRYVNKTSNNLYGQDIFLLVFRHTIVLRMH